MASVRLPVLSFPADMPAGYRVRVEYAVTSLFGGAPDPTSSAWTFAGYLVAPGFLRITGVRSGNRVWARGRGEHTDWLPSAWALSPPLDISIFPEMYSLSLVLHGDAVEALWTVNGATLGIQLEYSQGAIGHSPSYSFLQDADAGPGSVMLAGISLAEGQSIFVQGTPFDTYSPVTGVSGVAGSPHATVLERADPNAPRLTFGWSERTEDGDCGLAVDMENTVNWGFSGSMTGHTFSVYRYVLGEIEDGLLVGSGLSGTTFDDVIVDYEYDPVGGVLRTYIYEIVIVRTSDGAEVDSLFTPETAYYSRACGV